jgi:hypothetical protein
MMSRTKLRGAAAALLGVATIALAAAAPAWAADRRVTILNKTGYTMVEFYASAAGESDWQEDILGADMLSNGQSVAIDIDDGSGACVYDFKAVFDDGDELTRGGINVCEISTYTYQ